MNIPIEHIMVKGTAFALQLRKATKAFKELYVTPVREYLQGVPDHRVEVFGVLRPLLRKNKEVPSFEEGADRALEELRDLIRAGKMSHQDLVTLVMNGALGVGSPEMVVDEACRRFNKDKAAYSISVVKKKEDSVQWNGVDKASVGKLTDEYARLEDLEGIIRRAATAPVRADVLEKIKEIGKNRGI